MEQIKEYTCKELVEYIDALVKLQKYKRDYLLRFKGSFVLKTAPIAGLTPKVRKQASDKYKEVLHVPIVVVKDQFSRMLIADGCHRFDYAVKHGIEELPMFVRINK